MASLNGSSPAVPQRVSRGGRLASLLAIALLVAPRGLVAAQPEYLHEALGRFSTNSPAGWAYTIETIRDSRSLLERFDPSRPAGHQWSLLRNAGQEPTDKDRERYASSRPTADAGGPKANFQKEDIEPGSLQLVREDTERAEFVGSFRSAASESDKMLAHLRVRLTVHKTPAYVERYVLELTEPYWPVLGVKMNALTVTATFAAPREHAPSLPQTLKSEFSGRILLVPTTEKIEVKYSDFQRAAPELSR